MSSDDARFGGRGRINNETEHFTHPEGTPGLSCIAITSALQLPQGHWSMYCRSSKTPNRPIGTAGVKLADD
jgi:hypothetical protein